MSLELPIQKKLAGQAMELISDPTLVISMPCVCVCAYVPPYRNVRLYVCHAWLCQLITQELQVLPGSFIVVCVCVFVCVCVCLCGVSTHHTGAPGAPR